MPFRIGLKGVPLLLALGERLPFQKIIERLVRLADQRCPEPGLPDAVPLPDLERDRVEALQQIGQTARDAVVDAEFVDHGISPNGRATSPTRTRVAQAASWRSRRRSERSSR